MEFELKLQTEKTVVWEGKNGIDAAKRYVDCHREATVVAWRHYPRHGVFIGLLPIIEPGDKEW